MQVRTQGPVVLGVPPSRGLEFSGFEVFAGVLADHEQHTKACFPV